MSTTATTMDRRHFVTGAAAVGTLAAATPALARAAPAAPASAKADVPADAETDWTSYDPASTVQADVVVIGAGASGISCAVHAAELGKKVVLLEKSETLGGCSNSVFSGMVRTADDDIAAEVSQWVSDCHWRVDPSAISNLLNNSEAVFGSWLRDTWDWEFSDIVSMGVANWRIMTAYADRPANTPAKVGASGGDVHMVYEAFGRKPVCGGLPQNVGEGLKMCWAVGGAKPLNYGMQMPHQTFTDATDKLAEQFDDFPAKYPFLTTYMQSFLNVTKDGKRFRNEGILSSADAAANSSLYQGDFHWTIVSADQLALLEQGGIAAVGVDAKMSIPPRYAPEYDVDTPWENAQAVFEQMAANGTGFRGDTPEELAEAAGMDPEAFAETVAAYDACCAAGKDTVCGKDPQYLITNGNGPFYAVYTYQNNLTSFGGVEVDTSYHVLDASGAKVPGLYAIGVEAGSNLYNDTYCGVGVGVCLVYVSGYLCAEDIASA